MKLKRLSAICAAFVLVMAISVTVFAASGVTQCNRFWIDSGFTGNIQFIPAHVIEANEQFSLTKGKQVKQAYITAQRYDIFGNKTFDSGRQYTATASSKSSTSTIKKSYYIKDTSTQTEKIYYGWVYF